MRTTNHKRRSIILPRVSSLSACKRICSLVPRMQRGRTLRAAIKTLSLLALVLILPGCGEGKKVDSPAEEDKAAPSVNEVSNPTPGSELTEPATAPPIADSSSAASEQTPAVPAPLPEPPTEAGTIPTTSPTASAPVPAPPGWKTYVNTIDALPEEMKPKFVPFTFNYPEKFAVIPDDEVNFIKVEESITDPVQGTFTLENFAVGNMIANPEPFPGMDQELIYPMLLEQLGAQFAQGLPNYQKISEAPEKVAGLSGRSALFQAEFKGTDKGDIKFFGKILLVRQPGKERGVVIIMMATSLEPEIKDAADVGVKGDLGAILKSFQLTGE